MKTNKKTNEKRKETAKKKGRKVIEKNKGKDVRGVKESLERSGTLPI
jgi:hypothetical protein